MGRGCCARALPALLAHVNLLLAMYSGAALATGARLKWDPSTYVVAREALPGEYRAAAALLPAAAALLLLLAHVALAALLAPPLSAARRRLLLLYAAGMCTLLAAEACGAAWLRARVAGWLASPAARDLAAAARALRAHLVPMLEALAHLHPLPTRIKELMEEVEQDAPRNMYAAGGAGAVLLLLQAAGVLLALLLARTTARHRAGAAAAVHPPRTRQRTQYGSNGISPHERALLNPVPR